ncbi:MAG: ABC transporter permease [Sneathiella sp.]|jgi:peptide/nickel transport system permease protein|uniref:ABC transporter permease n=1 Tax=Sneathiella sp. TaxID=1964365 RepID=UPI000C6866BF|nr:ABC transporter permease [Sneathiella sp.]MAL78513.1 ABC transporter permease [Sneathiella sp.]|tara:strand:- start:700 stop:1650 length:951 start_codon:yes stop_codon:yes gene_type:complete
MSVFIAKRVLTLIATLIGASIVIFIVMEILPGDPALVILGVDASPEAIQSLTKELGLDRPPIERYWGWISGLLQGELGTSYAYKVPIWELIEGALLVTLPLAILSITLSIILALVIGLYAAANHNKAGDITLMGISQLGISVPNFWLAILLILLFAIELRWLPSGGFPGWKEGFWPNIRAMILPSLALATVIGAILARITRSSVLEVFREDYVRTARAKGLSQRATLWRHVLRNAMIPVLTVTGIQFAALLTGTVVVENVFRLPGLGSLVLKAINNRDTIVVENVVLLLAAMVIIVNFIVDLLYAVVDPRLKAHDI